MGVGLGMVGLVAGIALVAGYVRFSPVQPERWHVDPRTIDASTASGQVLLRPDLGDEGPVFAVAPNEILSALDEIALAEPRVSRLAGNPESGQVSYVARSALWHFPDVISVVAFEDNDQTQLAVYARQRFGSNDWGVNAERLERWFAQLQRQLPSTLDPRGRARDTAPHDT